MVARAWSDPDVPQARHAGKRLGRREELGLEVGPLKLIVVEKHTGRSQRHRVHPLLVLPAHAARHPARVVQERAYARSVVARAAGGGPVAGSSAALPEDVDIRRCTTRPRTWRYMVLPLRRAHRRLDEERLAALVTRDSLDRVARLPDQG